MHSLGVKLVPMHARFSMAPALPHGRGGGGGGGGGGVCHAHFSAVSFAARASSMVCSSAVHSALYAVSARASRRP